MQRSVSFLLPFLLSCGKVHYMLWCRKNRHRTTVFYDVGMKKDFYPGILVCAGRQARSLLRGNIMTNAQVGIMIAMIVYLIGMLLIGFAVSKKMKQSVTFIWEEGSWDRWLPR